MRLKLFNLFISMCFLFFSCGEQNKGENYTNQESNEAIGDTSDINVNENQEVPAPLKIIDNLRGTWTFEGGLENNSEGREATSNAPFPASRIEFTNEAKYTTWHNRQMIDSGRYRVNEQNAVLYLESIKDDRITEWGVSFDGNRLLLLERDNKATDKRRRFVFARENT